ncbi:tryptophan synthase subunit alpha [Candidatus Magnetaquicoccus inordinatus]|uniref:tryptophan synthase subunit alpha n=1 Tax=Candidatus Magnetaquicoccus inordinatus TaxID=2496818 RepID=UPI00102C77E2|nr:tryptophan synthase subunit alpha [Candidatus Magnetaquicoccus inordinatus]
MTASANTLPALQPYIQNRLATGKGKSILLMSHLVLGYPSLNVNREVIAQMIDNGVDMLELQIPFSEPVADGPVIARANQMALDNGFRVADGLALIAETVQHYARPFLIMTYYNILVAYGVEKFIREAARLGIRGLIIPDLPLQEATQAMAWCKQYGDAQGLDWIQLLTPTSSDARLQSIGSAASGFCYCVARKGVTGTQTRFDHSLQHFLTRCRQATSLPLAVGFGVKSASDVQMLTGLAEIAVVGSAAIELYDRQGSSAVGEFFAQLRIPTS